MLEIPPRVFLRFSHVVFTRHLMHLHQKESLNLGFKNMETLIRIKRIILAGRYAFSEKARIEMEIDGISEMDVAESIINAVAIYKTLHSRSLFRTHRRETLYIIQGTNLEGLPIYSKGKIVKKGSLDSFYFLISSKRAV